MRHNTYILPLFSLICLVSHVAHAQEPIPIEAQKYHEALLKHPNNPTVFTRFYDAWIDAQSIESLETFLQKRAETHGAIDYVILARYQLLRGQDPNALASLNKAIESLPNDSALLLERANLLIRTLDFVNARKDLEVVSKIGNEALSIEASKLVGKSYLREGNPEDAIKAWEKILTTHPKNEDLLEDLVELASSSEQPDQALKYSEKLIAASTDPYKKALRLIRRGELLAKSGENDKAITLWSETLSQTGEGSWLEREILAYIEQSFRRLDRIDLLSTKFEELATAHPRRLLIHRELAKLEAASGNIDSAIGRFREVLRRSPGETELREEFIRLLITSERFDDASAEIGKMLASTPNNPELHLRLAELAFQKAQLNPALDKKVTSDEIHKSLQKAREFLDQTESSGLRIANLMIRYGLEESGETLLKELSTKPDASTAPAEALAAEYTRTKRISKSLDILTELTKSSDPETILRAANAMAPLTKAEIPFNILLSRLPDFPNNNPYIAALIQASLAAKKPSDAISSALKLVRSSKLSSEIHEATKLASAVIIAAEKTPDIIAELSKIENRSNPEICLLAALLEVQNDHEKSDALFTNTTEPTLLRFHSSLLSVRGDFKAAIAALNRLSETAADNSASYFKELSDLQLRSDDATAALKTIEQWKIAAPTDKTPWTIASRLQRESGDHAAALETTRRALSRFSNDEDLTASLADLYQQTGERTEAERIYWKLYDQAPDTNSQSRWAARLATLASSHGDTEELKEKFLQRSRSNTQSIGPILALVELARVTNNQESLLEYLYQALRIKPKDIDIRLQVAATEKQAGNFEKQMAILNEGIDHDSSGRIRTSLAQVFIDQGQVIKGMHMLRALNGESAADPRFIETSASSIASAGLIPEAIQYLEESLPPKADWRSRFLLADLLQKDGREFEATSIFLSLMEAKDEIQGLIPNQNFERIQQRAESPEYYFQSLISFVSQEIYKKNNSNRSSGIPQQALPSSIEELHLRSKILLAFISNLGNPTLKEKIAAAEIHELNLISDIVACHSENYLNYLALLEKHPTNNDLVKMIIQQGRLRDPETGEYYTKNQTADIYKKLLASQTLDQTLRAQIILNILQNDPKNDEAWDSYFTLIDKLSNPQDHSNLYQMNYQLQNVVATSRDEIPSKHIPKIKEILLKNQSGGNQEITILVLLGEIDPWISAVNKVITEHQRLYAEQLKNQKQQNIKKTNLIDHYGFYPQMPQLRNLPLTSIHISYLQNITPQKFDINHNRSLGGIAAKDLIKHLDRFDSPAIRAFIAINADDQKAIKKSLSVKPSELEFNDFAMLKLWLDIDAKRYPDACLSLIKQFNDPSIPQNHVHWLKMSFLAIVLEIPTDKRSEFLPVAREIINFYIPDETDKSTSWRNNGYQTTILQTSKKLGFEDLVVKLTPPTNTQQQPQRSKPKPPSKGGSPLAIIPNKTNSTPPKQRPLTAIERFEQFSSEGKHLAAAHELLNHAQTQRKQGYDLSYIFSNTKISPEVRKEIISITDPSDNPSLSKRLAFAEICLALKATDEALTVLRTLAVERPFDSTINIQLALSLPEQEVDTAAMLLKQYSNSPTFYNFLNSNNQRINQARDNSTTFHYFSLITKFLEIADPEKFEYRAFSEINNQIYYFLSGSGLTSIPPLIGPKYTDQKDEKPDTLKHREISRRLTTAMLRHPLLAESGFRCIRSAKWIEEPNKIDELARTVILLESKLSSRQRNNSNNYPEFSAANWICDRLAESKSHKEIIPADFLTSVEINDPEIASLIKSFSTIKTTKDIASLWESGAMQGDNYTSNRSIFQQAVLEKIANIPAANDFFISRIKALTQDEIINSRSNTTGEYTHIPLIRAALASCKNQNDTSINNLCKTIINSVYGENFNFAITNGDTNSRDYQLLSVANGIIDSLLNRQSLDPVTAIRIFQAFDSYRVPIQNYYWVQNVFQKAEITDPKEAIEFLDSMGFLRDTSNWKPIAYSAMSNQYDQVTGTSTFSITRNLLNETIIQSFNYRMRTPEFVNLLEQRTPQTFGSLVTAAMFSTDLARRDRLMISAFKHAAPQLTKASPKQLEDFNLLASYLPVEAISILTPILQIKLKEQNDKKIDEILKTIDQHFKLIDANPTQEPFGMVDSYVLQLAPYNLDKATEVFLRAHTTYKANIGHYAKHQTYLHQTYFNNILSSFASDRKIQPESAIKFYQAVISSPNGSEFGYTSLNQGASHLYTLGSQLYSRLNSSVPKNIHQSIRHWYIVDQLPEEYRNDALAAMICFTFYNQNSGLPTAELTQTLEKAEGLSAKTREIIINCSHITNLRNLTPEDRTISLQHLSKLLNEPIFSPNTRTQIALSSLRSREILTLPAAAEIYAGILTNLSKQDQSMINLMVIDPLISVINKDIPAESIPHLRKISEAFWENANSPKSGGHIAMREDQALSLFIFAVKSGDTKNTELLLPKIRTISVGNLNTITNLILNDQFDLADQLLPNESEPFTSTQTTQHSIVLLEKLIQFSSKSKKPDQVLRLECQLINMRSLKQYGNELIKKIQERKQELTTTYLQSPPKSLQVRCEILNTIQSTFTSTDPAIEKEICEVAAKLDPKQTLSNWFNKYKSSNSNGLSEQQPFQTVCTAAMIHFLNGDPTLFISTCDAFVEISKITSIQEGYKLRLMIQSFLEPAFLTTAQAVAHDKTESFSRTIKPLRDLSLALSKFKNDTSVAQSLALHDFISHWENQPEDLTTELNKIGNIDNKTAMRSITFPREHLPFISELGNIQSGRGSSSFGPNTDKLLIAILSKPSLGNLLPTKSPWLNRIESTELSATFTELAKSPPETITPEGLTVLKLHNTTKKIRGIEAIESYQSILKDMPTNGNWDDVRIDCKIRLIDEMFRQQKEIPEIRVILDSIDIEKVSNYHISQYKMALEKLKNAEAKQQ